ncbi:hypothetical protein [Enteroscipio rubneri]|uniref:Uncharacterized protein n=1 Tax=Enteroscipio rubneri TaxID=2070686 RepID=A0A2K2UCJ3_9ACTN|nr:hypothetical protein [Enteroscipio rubneri]PNV68004.1 hypothetical protein C2L71_03920 [Enteroscipio rubneri]
MGRGSGPARIDVALLAAMLNPAIFVILLGGLLLGYDPAVLIVVGIVGYTTWGVLKYIANRQSRE